MYILIRKMTIEDIPAVMEIERLSFTMPWSERSFRFEVTENTAARCWVAEADGRVAANLVIWLIEDEAHVADIATHPHFRRQGIARRILSEGLASAKKDGARLAVLEVREGNVAAQEMYREFGFEVTGRREEYYKDNKEAALLMNASL